MAMFAPRLNQVFASRWKALFWAISVMISAYCFIPSAQDTEQSSPDDNAQAAAAIAALGGASSAASTAAPSPWSK